MLHWTVTELYMRCQRKTVSLTLSGGVPGYSTSVPKYKACIFCHVSTSFYSFDYNNLSLSVPSGACAISSKGALVGSNVEMTHM
jgi:hypothetical protein